VTIVHRSRLHTKTPEFAGVFAEIEPDSGRVSRAVSFHLPHYRDTPVSGWRVAPGSCAKSILNYNSSDSEIVTGFRLSTSLASRLDHVFERFYRTDRVRSRDTGGSGLGLTIARGLIQAHGGRIWAESVEGKGSTF
jgi:hypothetical protein